MEKTFILIDMPSQMIFTFKQKTPLHLSHSFWQRDCFSNTVYSVKDSKLDRHTDRSTEIDRGALQKANFFLASRKLVQEMCFSCISCNQLTFHKICSKTANFDRCKHPFHRFCLLVVFHVKSVSSVNPQ